MFPAPRKTPSSNHGGPRGDMFILREKGTHISVGIKEHHISSFQNSALQKNI